MISLWNMYKLECVHVQGMLHIWYIQMWPHQYREMCPFLDFLWLLILRSPIILIYFNNNFSMRPIGGFWGGVREVRTPNIFLVPFNHFQHPLQYFSAAPIKYILFTIFNKDLYSFYEKFSFLRLRHPHLKIWHTLKIFFQNPPLDLGIF